MMSCSPALPVADALEAVAPGGRLEEAATKPHQLLRLQVPQAVAHFAPALWVPVVAAALDSWLTASSPAEAGSCNPFPLSQKANCVTQADNTQFAANQNMRKCKQQQPLFE